MTWLNPIALVGLLAVAVPILVHLFGRRIAKRQRFPSLRLLQLASTTPVTRSQPSDLLLLLLRCAIIAAAALALAQPRWSSPDRVRAASVPTRLILVDTSESMRRLTSGGSVPRDLAILTGQRLLDSARAGMVVETAHPGANVAGAVSWLLQRSGRRELVILSDFQVGALSEGHLAAIPQGIGVMLRRVASASTTAHAESTGSISAHADGAVTTATWRITPADTHVPVAVQAKGADSVAAARMIATVRNIVSGPAASGRNVSIEFVDSSLLPVASSRLTDGWQGDLFLTLRRNRSLTDAINTSNRAPACEPPGATITATAGDVTLHSCLQAGSVAATALLAATTAALVDRPEFEERETSTVSDETLRRWERPATDLAPRGEEETSPDGRWLWLLALVLLAVEQIVRQTRKVRAADSVIMRQEDRVA